MATQVGKNTVALVVFGVVTLAAASLINSRRMNALSANGEMPTTALSGSTGTHQRTGRSSGTWNFKRIRISTPDKQLRVVLSDLSPKTDYVVGVRTSENAEEVGLVAGEVIFSESDSHSFRMISQIIDWPSERIDAQLGAITISGLSKAVGSVLLYITVAPGTEVSVDTPDKTLTRATPANSLVLHNGVSVARELDGIRTLVSQLERPYRPPNTTQIFKIQSDQYVATPKGLAANLTSIKKPGFPPGVAIEEIEQVILRVTIDETGIIRQIIPAKGNKAFLDAAVQAVSEWRFRPFSADGKHIPITASIVFFFGKNGVVSSPIFDEMGK